MASELCRGLVAQVIIFPRHGPVAKTQVSNSKANNAATIQGHHHGSDSNLGLSFIAKYIKKI